MATLWLVNENGQTIWRRDFSEGVSTADRALMGQVIGYSCDFDQSGNVYHVGYNNVPVVIDGTKPQDRPMYTLKAYDDGGRFRWGWSDAPDGNVSLITHVRTGPSRLSRVRCLPDGKVIVGTDFGLATLLSSDGDIVWTRQLSVNLLGVVTNWVLQETLQDVSLWYAKFPIGGAYAYFSNLDGSFVGIAQAGNTIQQVCTMLPDGTTVVAGQNGDIFSGQTHGLHTFVFKTDPLGIVTYLGATSAIQYQNSIKTDGDIVVICGSSVEFIPPPDGAPPPPTNHYCIFDFNADFGGDNAALLALNALMPGDVGVVSQGALAEDVLYVGDKVGTVPAHRRSRSMAAVSVGQKFVDVNDARTQDGLSLWAGTRSQGTFIPAI